MYFMPVSYCIIFMILMFFFIILISIGQYVVFLENTVKKLKDEKHLVATKSTTHTAPPTSSTPPTAHTPEPSMTTIHLNLDCNQLLTAIQTLSNSAASSTSRTA